jgi:tetratricopeptide (TPR) repeat protein
MWNLTTDPVHLEHAVEEAQVTLAMKLPPEAKVIPQFCLAKNALRLGKSRPESELTSFMDASGESAPPGTAVATIALLALDANDRDLYAKYRELLLEKHSDNPQLQPVVSYFRDRHHRYRMFRATHGRFGFTRAERHAVGRNVAALDEPADTRLMEAGLATLDGGKLRLPRDTSGKYTFLAFLELPADEESAKSQDGLIRRMTALADRDIAKGIRVIAAFLCEDTDRIKAFVEENEWACEVALVPDGLKNPLVVQHGILSADRMPNIFLLRGDGSISWSVSGLTYPVQGSSMEARIANAIDANITVCQMEAAENALEKGDFEQAKQLFSDALAPAKIKGDWWATFRFYGRARAYVGLKDWEAALADMDTAILAHSAFGWGKPHRCDLVAEMQLYKADILEQLGRATEAKEERQKAAEPTHPHNISPFGLYTEGLENFRLSPH